jgi:serine/threonine protein kinase/tetratricopeptide (TPR) repeat protein
MEAFRGTSRFRVERQIGSGGMGVVYEAADTERQGERVALKTLRNLDAASLLRFKEEFRALADIHHENLVRFGELVAEGSVYFFTMELLRGLDFLTYVRPGVASASIGEGTTDLAAETLAAASSVRGAIGETTRTGQLDEARLRSALGQLARGLAGLHAAGKVHRDVKPTNVLVDHDRVVIVDFGLVTDTNASAHVEAGIAGTVAYMAPEQGTGGAVGPAADWYAVGVMLYEALTGQVPFFGSAYEVLTTKRSAAPPHPRDAVPDAPKDLDALCMDLLAADPDARPNGEAILRRLGIAPAARTSLMPASSENAPFVGRRRELEQLHRAYEQARRGTCVTVYIHGESGLGKTALARHFIAEMSRSDPQVIVLKGRCYERESVPYKAVDGVVDALGRYLQRVPRSELAAMLPATAGRLSRAFPVLERLKAVDPKENPASSVLDPMERRARVFYAMRDLLHALAEARLVVMLIDDLQWADADSLLLLREVMRPPFASIMLVATVRTEREIADSKAGGPAPSLPASRLNVGSSTMPGDVRIVHLEPLGEAEARALAEALIQRADGSVPESAAESIAREAAGHPLFIDELVRHAWVDGPTAKKRAHVRLEDALWGRIQIEGGVERKLLEVLAVARGPLSPEAAAIACGLAGPHALDELVAKLRFERLVRTTRVGEKNAVEVFHDRVRRAVLAHLDAPEAEIHARIATALEACADGDFEALAEHHRGAGALEKACAFAMRAADAAGEKLAFDRAARLYDWAMAMHEGAATKETLLKLATAHASVGRGPAAADAYLRAAKLGGDPAELLDLRRRAAHHLLTTGHTREGMEVLHGVMDALGIQLATTGRRALVSLAMHRARLRVRGLAFKPHTASAEDNARADAYFTAAAGLAFVDTLRGAEVDVRGLLFALGAGDASRVARALATEAAYVAMSGDESRERWRALLDRARDIAAEHGDARTLALVVAAEGVALHLSGYWLAARSRCQDALRLLREHAPSATWEIDAATLYGLRSLLELGQLGALRAELPDRLADAEARGDRFAQNNIRAGDLNLVWLAFGDVDNARRELDAATRDAEKDAIHLPHLQELLARARIDLYVGDAAGAHRRVVDRWGAIERSQLLRIQHQRVILCGLRARAALASARGAPSRALLDEAAKFANDLARSGAAWGLAEAAMLRGCIGQALGDAHRAAVSFEQAARDYTACDMALHVAVARLRMGKVIGGDEGRNAVTQSREWMTAQGIADPEALAAVLAP